mmetsp:Transcript_124257/g.357023  ORF Transcript_124257/g.357023 Transcript_124257/m.357023 type:complete len:227 (+) Transcript_124257:458-1138(+)
MLKPCSNLRTSSGARAWLPSLSWSANFCAAYLRKSKSCSQSWWLCASFDGKCMSMRSSASAAPAPELAAAPSRIRDLGNCAVSMVWYFFKRSLSLQFSLRACSINFFATGAVCFKPVRLACLFFSMTKQYWTKPYSTATSEHIIVKDVRMSAIHICCALSGSIAYTELLKVRMISTGTQASIARAGAALGSTKNCMYASIRKIIEGNITSTWKKRLLRSKGNCRVR